MKQIYRGLVASCHQLNLSNHIPKALYSALLVVGSMGFVSNAVANPGFPANATVTTLGTFPFPIEGLAADSSGNFYTADRPMTATNQPSPGVNCTVYKVDATTGAKTVVGSVPTINSITECSTSGLEFDHAGNLYIAETKSGRIFNMTPPFLGQTATLVVSNVPGANGIVFDPADNLWIADGNSNQGRVWKVTANVATADCGTLSNCIEAFRIQPMRNSSSFGGTFPGINVGRQITDFGNTGSSTSGTGGQVIVDIVANGIAFKKHGSKHGSLLVADTARGAIWQVFLDDNGNVDNSLSPMGCDTTFNSNTLCLSNVLVAHPLLEDLGGIALDSKGNIWGTASARQAIVYISFNKKTVFEVFRNPVNSLGLRNSSDTDNTRIVESPTTPVLVGKRLCTSNADQNKRDNAHFLLGEVANGGKISCIDQPLLTPGVALPVQ